MNKPEKVEKVNKQLCRLHRSQKVPKLGLPKIGQGTELQTCLTATPTTLQDENNLICIAQ